jgi:hypothetical protein
MFIKKLRAYPKIPILPLSNVTASGFATQSLLEGRIAAIAD